MPHDAIGQEVNIGDLVVTNRKNRYIPMLVTTILPVASSYVFEPCIDTSYIIIDVSGAVARATKANLRHLKLSTPNFIKVPNYTIETVSPVFDPFWATITPENLGVAKDMYRRAFELMVMNLGNPKFKLPKDFR